MAIVEDFYNILQQVHNKDCLHASSRKTFAGSNLSVPVSEDVVPIMSTHR